MFVVSVGVSFLCVAGHLLPAGQPAGELLLGGRPLTQVDKDRLAANITNAISAYDATTGAPLNPTLVTGLKDTSEMCVADGALYVTSTPDMVRSKRGLIGKYDAVTGAPLNPTLVDNKIINMEGMAVVGNSLYVAALDRRVRVYDKTSGAAIGGFSCAFPAPAHLVLVGVSLLIPDNLRGRVAAYDVKTGNPVDTVGIKGIPQAQDIVLSEGALYVLSRNGTVGKYDAATLAVINPALVFGLVEPSSLAVAHGTIYISTRADNTVATYDARTGRRLNPSLIEGLTSPWSLAVSENTLYVTQHR